MGRPVSEIESKRFSIYLPVEFMKEVRLYCASEGVSLNALIRTLLVDWIDDRVRCKKHSEEAKKALDAGW